MKAVLDSRGLRRARATAFDGKAWTIAQGWQGLQNLFYNGIPEMDFNNIQSLDADRLTGLNKSLTNDYTDTLIWTKGRHTMKFGLNIQTLEAVTPLGFNGSDNYGTYTFNSAGSVGMFTGVDFADFLLGLPNASFYDTVQQDNDGISSHYHFFGQDEWRLSPKLTLSYGLRYEFHPGYYDKFGDIGNFDPTVPLSGRVIYPQGKQALLAQAFLASANACDPDGVNATNSATVNGAPCMQVLGNSDGALSLRTEEGAAPALYAPSWLCLSAVCERQVGDSRRRGHVPDQPARLELLFAHRHIASADGSIREQLQPRHARHRIPVAADLCGLRQLRRHAELRTGLLRHGQQRELEGSLHDAMVVECGPRSGLRVRGARIVYRLGDAAACLGSG